MKKLTCIILSLIIISGSVLFTACNSGNKPGEIKVLATAGASDKTAKTANTSKSGSKSSLKPPAEVKTVSSSELSASSYKSFVNECESILYSYGFEGEVYITEHGKPIFKKGIGYANKKKKIKNNEHTLFRIASVTKQFTAAAILLLQERGMLSVNDTLGKYFPEYKSAAKVKIENVLRMQGGLPDYMNYYANVKSFFDDYEKALKSSSKENRKVIQKNFMGDPMLFNQGDSYKYSNSGYMLLGEIIEKVSGSTYEDFLKTEIFDKLGMDNTGFIEELDDTADNVAQPYSYKKGNLDVFKIKGAAFACGNMYSTVMDLSKWADGLRKGKIISKKSFEEMTYDKKKIGYGYGLFLMPGGTVVFHTGNLAPYNSILLMSLGNSELAVTAISNSNYYATETVGKALYNKYAAYSAG